MNDKRGLILIICIMIFFIGCQTASRNNVEREVSLDYKAYFVRSNGYRDGVIYPMITVIDSTERLTEYYTANRDAYDLERREKVYADTTIGFMDAIDKYDDVYFKDHVLVFVLLEEGSGSIRHKITDVKRYENRVEVGIKRIVPEIGTDDMAQWHVMIEVKKDAYNNSEMKVIIE